MFSARRPYNFHIELTDRCNAGCPMCSRTDPLDHCRPNAEKVRKIDLTLADFEAHFTMDFCRNVGEIELGGGLGDPLAAPDCLAICDHLTARGVDLVISTNGGLRGTEWWARLGHLLLRTRSRVQLHVDGLRDTNPLYRVNTDFDKIMANIAAYIATGARAEWYFILFRHNEHQVEQARALSREMGFARFVLIDTIRFGTRRHFAYQMPSGEWRALEPARRRSSDYGDAAPPADSGGEVNGVRCKSALHNRPYINAAGTVSACCWTSGSPEEVALHTAGGASMAAYNIRNRPLAEILADEPFASRYAAAWRAASNPICNRKCRDGVRNSRRAV